jgi:acyl-homoserine-lactone acylase
LNTRSPKQLSRHLILAITVAAATLTCVPTTAGEATLYRDSWGVPHIWADDFGSAGYAIGQAQCEDSLHNVIYCLHAGVGRLSELFGPGMLTSDIEARKLRHGALAERDWPKLSRPVRELIEGFCVGVNNYFDSHPDEILVPIEKVTPVQVVAWHRSLLMLSAVGVSKADAEASKSDGYHPIYNPDKVGTENADTGEEDQHPGIPPGKSNSWALAGVKTASGAPMLLIDPHWMSEGHLQLYEFWLHVRDELDVGGFALTGTPLPGLGITPSAAWTVTAGGADSSDAYALKINSDNPHQYEFDGQWEEMDVRKETIRIRQPDGSTRKEHVEVLATRHGPILDTKGGVPYAAAMGGYDRADAFDQYFQMAAARTTEQFKRAIALNRMSYFNLMWATTEGDIGFVQTGQAPLRPEGFNWNKMVPGWTSASLYRGRVPFEEHPTVENPVTGFLQNCNVAADVVTPGLAMTPDDFPPGVLFGHYGAYRARGARATRLLTQIDKATLEDGRRIAFDSYIPPADLWVPSILQAWSEHKSASNEETRKTEKYERLQEAVKLIGSWNRMATRDSEGATMFRFWRLACNDMDSKIGRDAFSVPNTPEIRRDALTALQNAADHLHKNYGRISVPWGDVKRLRRGTKEWPLSGDGLGKLGMDALRATAADSFDDQHKLIPKGGQCVTSVVMLTSPPTIRAVVAYGQSNKPGSTHYDDQAPLYSEERFREVPWTLDQLRPHVESEKTFTYER